MDDASPFQRCRGGNEQQDQTAAEVEEALRRWRREEARRRGVPAFRIFSDQALQAIAARRPSSGAELPAIPGIGISTVEKHGAQIYRILGAAP